MTKSAVSRAIIVDEPNKSSSFFPKCQQELANDFRYDAIIPGSWDDENVRKACKVWSLTEDEVHKLRDLQQRLSDIVYWKNEPHHVLWFMKGPFGYANAEKHFRRMVQWRRTHNIDAVLDKYSPPKLLLNNTPSAVLHGCDRDGDPIYVERGGAMDANYLMKHHTREEMVRYAVWVRETHFRGAWKDEYEKQHGHPVKNITIIYDLKGLSASQLSPKVLDVFKEVIAITKNYYSAPIKRILVIRAPTIFRLGWSIVKHIFPLAARKKMVFAGPEDYSDVVSKYIDPQVLPPCIYSDGRGRIADGMPHILGEGNLSYKNEDDVSTETLGDSWSLSEKSSYAEHDGVDDAVTVSCHTISLLHGVLEDSDQGASARAVHVSL